MHSRFAAFSSFKKASFYPFLLGTMALQIFVCVVLIPALFLSDEPMCGARRGVMKEGGRNVLTGRASEIHGRRNVALRNPPVSKIKNISRDVGLKTTKNNLAHIPRPFTILTSTNRGFLDLTVNLIISVRRLELEYNITIIAEDPEAYRYLTQNLTFHDRNLRIEQTKYGLSHPTPQKSRHFSFGYQRLVNKRPQYLIDKLKEGFDTLVVDVDYFWFRDPLDIIVPNYSKYDVWLAQGHDGKNGHKLMYFKSNVVSVGVVRHWISRLLNTKGEVSDQQSLNDVLKTRRGQRLRVSWLDKANFPTGDE